MGSSLTENITSTEQAAENALTHSLNKVLVVVESESDILFWKDILSREYPDKDFMVGPFVCDQPKGKGKQRILEMARTGKFGSTMIGCVDSDNDWLLEKWTVDGITISHNQYLLQTYAYALENIALGPEGLAWSLLESTFHDDPIQRTIEKDYQVFIQAVSKILYPVLLWHLTMIRENRDADKVGKAWEDLLQKGKYSGVVEAKNIPWKDKIRDFLSELEKLSLQLIANYEAAYGDLTDGRDELEKALRDDYGLTEDNAYLHVHAHALYDFISYTYFKVVEKYILDNHTDKLKQCVVPKNYKEALGFHKDLCHPIRKVRMKKAHKTVHTLDRYADKILADVRSLPL